MARRGKSQAKRSGRGSGGVPGWLWLAGGILVGIAIAAGFVLRDRLGAAFEGPRPNPAATAPAATSEEPVAQQPVEPKKPRYDFYTVLSEREVEVGDAELRAKAQAEAQTPAQPAEDADAGNERYLLQAGAFSEAARAEEVKAAIAFTGLVARVEAATTAEGRTVHRVLLGPYGNARDLESAKHTLAANGIKSVAVRVR